MNNHKTIETLLIWKKLREKQQEIKSIKVLLESFQPIYKSNKEYELIVLKFDIFFIIILSSFSYLLVSSETNPLSFENFHSYLFAIFLLFLFFNLFRSSVLLIKKQIEYKKIFKNKLSSNFLFVDCEKTRNNKEKCILLISEYNQKHNENIDFFKEFNKNKIDDIIEIENKKLFTVQNSITEESVLDLKSSLTKNDKTLVFIIKNIASVLNIQGLEDKLPIIKKINNDINENNKKKNEQKKAREELSNLLNDVSHLNIHSEASLEEPVLDKLKKIEELVSYVTDDQKNENENIIKIKNI